MFKEFLQDGRKGYQIEIWICRKERKKESTTNSKYISKDKIDFKKKSLEKITDEGKNHNHAVWDL